jgi:hypothetical protein
MSEASKSARKAAADKVKKLVGADPSGKPVDASSYTPPDALKTGVKTGMRPVSKRQFKKGGKVIGKMHGEKAHHHAGRKPRKAGGSAMPPVDRLVNRDMKKANEYRDGDKHIGGMKKGGRIHKDMGGMSPQAAGAMQDPRMIAAARMAASNRANVPQAMLQSMPTSSKISHYCHCRAFSTHRSNNTQYFQLFGSTVDKVAKKKYLVPRLSVTAIYFAIIHFF